MGNLLIDEHKRDDTDETIEDNGNIIDIEYNIAVWFGLLEFGCHIDHEYRVDDNYDSSPLNLNEILILKWIANFIKLKYCVRIICWDIKNCNSHQVIAIGV